MVVAALLFPVWFFFCGDGGCDDGGEQGWTWDASRVSVWGDLS
jgi:hypothetical protein